MISRDRLRQGLILCVLVGSYLVQRAPVVTAQDPFCDQLCHPNSYCGYGCYDEANQAYTDCWGYSGGNCDETYPSCDTPYSSGNWPIITRVKIGRNTEQSWGHFVCREYYSVHAESLCGLGDHFFCERQTVDLDNCEQADWGYTCNSYQLYDCYPGNDCH